MYFHNSLIPRGAYFLLPLESKQEATSGWNFTKCISEVKVNQLKVKNMHVRMGISGEIPINVCEMAVIKKSVFFFFFFLFDDIEIVKLTCVPIILKYEHTCGKLDAFSNQTWKFDVLHKTGLPFWLFAYFVAEWN